MQPAPSKSIRISRYLFGTNVAIFLLFLLLLNSAEAGRDPLIGAMATVLVPASALILLATPVAALILMLRNDGRARLLAGLSLLLAAVTLCMTAYLVLRSGGC